VFSLFPRLICRPQVARCDTNGKKSLNRSFCSGFVLFSRRAIRQDRVFDPLSRNETNCPVVATHDEGRMLFPVGHATWRMTNVGNTASRAVTIRHETMTSMAGHGSRKMLWHGTSTMHAYVTRSGKVERASRGLRSRKLDRTGNRVSSCAANGLSIALERLSTVSLFLSRNYRPLSL